jgi:DNA-binding FrmR family transcriptional regulator
MDSPPRHDAHPQLVNRLKRAEGHLRKVIGMIEDGRPCVEIAQQLHAVERAVCSAKATLIHEHLDHCLDAVVGPMDAAQRREIEGFKAIARYL